MRSHPVANRSPSRQTKQERHGTVVTLISGIVWILDPSKYPPTGPEALRLLAPQRGRSQPVKSKNNRNSSSVAKQWASAKRKQQREVYSRNSQSSTATPTEPGDLPFGLEPSISLRQRSGKLDLWRAMARPRYFGDKHSDFDRSVVVQFAPSGQ